MEKINDLLRQLNNRVPVSISKRIDGLNKLNQKLALARQENEENPTEESQEKLEEIIDFISDTQDDLIDDLKELVIKKRNQEAELEQRQRLERQRQQEIEKRRLIAQRKEEAEKEKAETTDSNEEKESIKSKKTDSIGWGSLILGGALLVLSAGAINYFGKRK